MKRYAEQLRGNLLIALSHSDQVWFGLLAGSDTAHLGLRLVDDRVDTPGLLEDSQKRVQGLFTGVITM